MLDPAVCIPHSRLCVTKKTLALVAATFTRYHVDTRCLMWGALLVHFFVHAVLTLS
ncbi:hypothetical protein GMOD_00004735 [Pyrenophora seminiperda CCB06]|uniref:Uncharacterized protein n=1 Tax=Pyrenophora seminiperda CCB06 TaxID=1302712 RepID=A0A3M7MHK5_9PLEO|nr:hypothetical protein GMOD_00004735 [Pyrenophora seminiperda CCB06]